MDCRKEPHEVKPLASRLVFKLKLDADGAIEHYKARRVALGDQQVEGMIWPQHVLYLRLASFGEIQHDMGTYIPVAYTHAFAEEN